jgi:inner membrane protein
MDSLTQIALGTVISEVFFRQSLGRRALFFGAFCGWFPDIDVFFHAPNSWASLEAHRGITHSLLCLPFFALALGEFAHRVNSTGKRWQWIHLAFWALITHPILDLFTSYGTQVFAPLSNHRYSLDSIAIIDLLYSLPLFAAVFIAFSNKLSRQRSRQVSMFALGYSTLYLGICFLMSTSAETRAETQFKAEGFAASGIRVNTPIFLPFLRRVTARDANGNLVTTTVSMFSSQTGPVHHYERPEHPALNALFNSSEGQLFSWFSDGFEYILIEADHISILDARYGLFLNPWQSFFAATATLDTDGQPQKLQRSQRPKDVDYSAEYKAGFRRMLGD